MKIFIPEISTKLKLIHNLEFDCENYEMFELSEKSKGAIEIVDSNKVKYDAYNRDLWDKRNLAHTLQYNRDDRCYEIYDEIQNIVKSKDPNSVFNVRCCIKSGAVLNVERVYIRKGASDYSSLTVRILSYEGNKLSNIRFYIPLEYANKMEVEVI